MIFQLDTTNKSAIALTQTSYTDLKIKEDYIESLIKDNPTEFLDEDIKIIGEQISDWNETNERCDLLGIDKDGKLVVIEVKRDGNQHRDKDVTIQSIKYASYFSTYQMKDVIEQYQKYTCSKNTTEEIKRKILEYLDKEDDFEIDNDPRIILIGKGFSPEVTSSVLWLREHEIDIKCISIVPYKESSGNVYIDRKTIIPLEETKDFMIQRKEKDDNIKDEQDSKNQMQFDSLISAINSNVFPKYDELSKLSTGTNHSTFYYYGNRKYHYEILTSSTKRYISVDFHFECGIDEEKFNNFIETLSNELQNKGFAFFTDKKYQKGCTYKIELPCRFSSLGSVEIKNYAESAAKKLGELYEIVSDYVNKNLFVD